MEEKMKKLLVLFMLLSFNVFAGEQRFSGDVLPRFMALKANKINARVGPNVMYPVKYVYTKKFLPVVVINEYYGWYQIKDVKGDLSWVYISYLTSKPYAMTQKDGVYLYEKPKMTADILAKVNKGIIFSVDKCKDNFCEVKTSYMGNVFEGYILEDELYGIN